MEFPFREIYVDYLTRIFKSWRRFAFNSLRKKRVNTRNQKITKFHYKFVEFCFFFFNPKWLPEFSASSHGVSNYFPGQKKDSPVWNSTINSSNSVIGGSAEFPNPVMDSLGRVNFLLLCALSPSNVISLAMSELFYSDR